MRHAASLRLETAATHGSAFAVSKSALSIHSYVDMGGVGPPSEKNRFSASTASADEPNTHFVHSVADFNNLAGDGGCAAPPLLYVNLVFRTAHHHTHIRAAPTSTVPRSLLLRLLLYRL